MLPIIAEGDMEWLMDISLKLLTCNLAIHIFCEPDIRKGIWKYSKLCTKLEDYYHVLKCQLEEENIPAYKYSEQSGYSGSLTGKPKYKIPFD